jgi:DNA-binding NarL/FixJ family response regulator
MARGCDEHEDCLPELFDEQQWCLLAKALELTPRQWAVARGMCRGLKRGVIARQLGVSENTVRTHVRGLFSRLKVCSRLGLAVRLVLTERALAAR